MPKYTLEYLQSIYGEAFKGYRDIIWCPFANEPTFLQWDNLEADCGLCKQNYEPETHEFITHIQKPHATD